MIALSNHESPDDTMLSIDAGIRRICSEEYAAAVSPFFASVPISSDRNFDFNIVQSWQTDLCILAEAVSNPFTGFRSRKEIQEAGHVISVTRFLSGKEQGELNGKVIDRLPGPIYVVDQALPVRTVTSQMHVQQVYIPKAILNLPESLLQGEVCIQPSSPSGLLLHTCLDQLFEILKTDPDKISQAAIERFFALLKTNVGVHPDREDVRCHYRQSLFERIIFDIEQSLGDPDFSTDTILSRFGVSRASLYRMFEPYGGVRTYIMQRRVARAVMDIEERQGEHGRLRQAVERWGFSSQPNFNRTIRREFGTNPSGLFQPQNHAVGLPKNSDRVLREFLMRAAA
jgi:AraC-like DNA-binding protein